MIETIFDFLLANWGELLTTSLLVFGSLVALVKFFGKKYFDGIFSKQLEDFKALKNVELENLKHSLNQTINRSRLNQEYEYRSIPELWGVFNSTYKAIENLTPRMWSIPDFNKYSISELKEFGEINEWSSKTIAAFQKSKDKSRFYIKLKIHEDIENARSSLVSFESKLKESSIFLPNDVYEECLSFLENSIKVLSGYRVGEEMGDHKLKSNATKTFNEKLNPQYEVIRKGLIKIIKPTDQNLI